MRGGFEPLLPGFTVVDFNDLAAAEAAITDETAGFMLEPVQGEGGIRPATQEFLSGLRALCDKHGLLLILAEEIGRAHVLTPVTNAHLVCRLLPEKKKRHTCKKENGKNKDNTP